MKHSYSALLANGMLESVNELQQKLWTMYKKYFGHDLNQVKGIQMLYNNNLSQHDKYDMIHYTGDTSRYVYIQVRVHPGTCTSR